MRSSMPASTSRPAPASATSNAYLASLNGVIYGDDPADGFVRGRRFVHPRLGFTFTAPEGFALENTAQAVLGVKSGGAEAMRLDVVRIPAEQSLQDYLVVRLDRRHRAGQHGDLDDQRFSRGDRRRKGRPMVVPALCDQLRHRRLSVHLCGEEQDRGNGSRIPDIGRDDSAV